MAYPTTARPRCFLRYRVAIFFRFSSTLHAKRSPIIRPSFGAQTRESRTFTEETREIAQGERIRLTGYDKEIGVRSGDLGTVTRIGQDHSMTVKMDSGKIAEVSSEKSRYVDYGYAVEGFKNLRAERVIATGDGLSQQSCQGVFFESGSRFVHQRAEAEFRCFQGDSDT